MEQVGGLSSVNRPTGGSETDSYVRGPGPASHQQWFGLDGLADLLHPLQSLRGVGLPKHSSHVPKGSVAGGMAVNVVELLEMVDIHMATAKGLL